MVSRCPTAKRSIREWKIINEQSIREIEYPCFFIRPVVNHQGKYLSVGTTAFLERRPHIVLPRLMNSTVY